MSFSIVFHNVYLQNASSIVGPKEMQGPYALYYDTSIKDCYFGQKSFEQGEVELIKKAIEIALKKAHLRMKDIPLVFGGDLSNQLAISSLAMKTLHTSAIGVYSACATIALALGLLATYVEYGSLENGMAFASSNYAVAERQFRYPNDYGIQKKDSTTTTITGAAAFILGRKKSPIRITELTYGEVYDPKQSDVNDMGSPMAYAAYRTIMDHLNNHHQSHLSYDLIVTGDLSAIGTKVLKDCFAHDGIELSNHLDAGLTIYKREQSQVYAGGSGPACIAVVTASYIIQEMLKRHLRRVLIVATGALYSPTVSYQKNNIAVIAHALTLEVEE